MVARNSLAEDFGGNSATTQSSTMPNEPWADERNESIWEDVAHRTKQTPLRADNTNTQDVPNSLRPGAASERLRAEENAWDDTQQPTSTPVLEGAPDVLKPGNPVRRAETNPFLRKKLPESQVTPPTDEFSRLGVDEQSRNPWQPPISQHERTPSPQPPLPPKSQPEPSLLDEQDPWAGNTPPLRQQQNTAPSPTLISLPSRSDSPAWDEDPLGKNQKPISPPVTTMSDELIDDQHVWDDLGNLDKGKGKAPNSTFEDWNLVEGESSTNEPGEMDGKPPLPPRRPTEPAEQAEPASWKPTRQAVDGKTETYLIKNILWHDHTAAKNPRKSPILIQNANGPCPLVALVNALTLTTPADDHETALVVTLRSREQVSLNLLLDAVLDELMSPRRTNSEDALPDVGDLYNFLQSLHTGMNVNPRFIPTPQMVNAYKRTSLTHLHPTERGDLIPGTFENTAEMGLYATFSIPLIHGWLPSKSEIPYESLARQAASYEDAQNLLFREEELEDKLSNSEHGLTESEQQLYHDILIIKEFLHTSATQLTPWGIEVIGKAIRPGTFAILFRNDHFSTLYCHPQTMQLLTLVTDAGYKSHGDIVWETLVDTNGERTEFLSGDFTVVGVDGAIGSTSAGNYSHEDGGEWTTVNNKRGKSRQAESPPLSPSTEQEDRDLALALQLQEEEDERHRSAEARRRRESLLSEQFIEQQARQPNLTTRGGLTPARGGLGSTRGGRNEREGQQTGITTRSGDVPPIGGIAPIRSSSNSANIPVTTNPRPRPNPQVIRPMIPPRTQAVNRPAEEGGDDAPPTYEQAAQDVAYVPPVGHPNHAASSSDIRRTTSGLRQQTSARRTPMAANNGGNPQGRDRDRDCIVM